MLEDMIIALLITSEKREKERAYRNLERVGIDRSTADAMAAEYYKPEVKANA